VRAKLALLRALFLGVEVKRPLYSELREECSRAWGSQHSLVNMQKTLLKCPLHRKFRIRSLWLCFCFSIFIFESSLKFLERMHRN